MNEEKPKPITIIDVKEVNEGLIEEMLESNNHNPKWEKVEFQDAPSGQNKDGLAHTQEHKVEVFNPLKSPVLDLKSNEKLFADCMRDVISDGNIFNYKILNDFFEELKEEIENAQEYYSALHWLDKGDTLEIIDKLKLKHFGKELE